jgi:hypothetical protein
MRGQNSLNEVYKHEQMRQIEESIQEKIDNYLNELDELAPSVRIDVASRA